MNLCIDRMQSTPGPRFRFGFRFRFRFRFHFRFRFRFSLSLLHQNSVVDQRCLKSCVKSCGIISFCLFASGQIRGAALDSRIQEFKRTIDSAFLFSSSQ